MFRRAAVLLSVSAILAVASPSCSSQPGSGGPGPVGPPGASDGGTGIGADGGAEGLSVDSACAVLNARRCAFLQRCGLIATGNDAKRDCELYFTATECGPSRWPVRVKEGTLRYSSTAAQACAAAWDVHECDSFASPPQSCSNITTPNAVLGGVCYGGRTQECKEGVCTGGTCPRKCRLPGAPGDICETSTDCGSNLYCQKTLSGGVLGTCAAWGTTGSTCDAQRPCGHGFYCRPDFSVCEPVRKVGEACVTGQCEASAFCSYGANGGFCVSRGVEGDACADDAQCRAELICLSETGTCAPRGPLPLNASCSRRQQCTSGLACVGTQPDPFSPPSMGTCLPPMEEGETCTSSYDCQAPLSCGVGTDGGTCDVRLADGQACHADRDCQLFSRCVNAACTPVPRPGDPCTSLGCLYGACASDVDGGTRCGAALGLNAACTRNDECASLRCEAGACLAVCSP